VGYQAWADRYAYLPSLGVFAALAWELRGLAARFPRGGLVVLGVVAPLLLAGVTRHTLGFWRDSESLFRRALAVDPGNARAHLALGNVYGGQGRHAAALAAFEAAARLDPRTEGLAGNLGYEYTVAGRFEEALPWLDMAAAAAPGDEGARREAAAARARVERARARAGATEPH
jgi:Flp pilus assembly protein TadD